MLQCTHRSAGSATQPRSRTVGATSPGMCAYECVQHILARLLPTEVTCYQVRVKAKPCPSESVVMIARAYHLTSPSITRGARADITVHLARVPLPI